MTGSLVVRLMVRGAEWLLLAALVALSACSSDEPEASPGAGSDAAVSRCTLLMSTTVAGSLAGTPFTSQLVEFSFRVPAGAEVMVTNPGGEFQSHIEVPPNSMTFVVDGVTQTVTTAMRFTEGFAPGFVNLAVGDTGALTELLFSDEVGAMPFEVDRDITGSGTVGDWASVEVQSTGGRLILDSETDVDATVRYAASGCQ